VIKTQPKQHQAALYSILSLCSKKENKSQIFTGEVYEIYKNVCDKTGIRPLTQRRVSDVIAEFDMLGIINAKVISKGRYGRTRDIALSISESTEKQIKTLLEEGLNLS
jgi:cell division control protein 6